MFSHLCPPPPQDATGPEGKFGARRVCCVCCRGVAVSREGQGTSVSSPCWPHRPRRRDPCTCRRQTPGRCSSSSLSCTRGRGGQGDSVSTSHAQETPRAAHRCSRYPDVIVGTFGSRTRVDSSTTKVQHDGGLRRLAGYPVADAPNCSGKYAMGWPCTHCLALRTSRTVP